MQTMTTSLTTPPPVALPTDQLLPHMRHVSRCERALHELHLMWRLIESSAKMHCAQEARSILPMMAATREGFGRLEQDLVQSMASTAVAEVMAGLQTDARQIIDTVVRNLYERTADVGFLAADTTLCRFVAGLGREAATPATSYRDQDAATLAQRAHITQRLCAYRSYYTVYNDILLVDTQGNVLAHIDTHTPVEGTRDALLPTTLQSSSYVQTFRASDLRPQQAQALLYSHAMLHPQTGQPCGALCLSFDFLGELAGIFAGSRAAQGRCVGLLLDGDNRVIASSAPHWVPTGLAVPTNPDGRMQLFTYAGRSYLVATAQALPYQGYAGPAGWKGQIMLPLELAFHQQDQHCVEQLPPAVAQGLLSHAQRFCPPLYEVIRATGSIQRVVWNGQVMTAGQRNSSSQMQAVLEQIGETGARTDQVFSQSIRDLYDTVLTSGLRDGQSLTQWLVDLLDRNLYERANDCRWWALSPVLQQLLATHAHSPAQGAALLPQATQVLRHIHSLYTVYTRLMVYDAQGRMVCTSEPAQPDGVDALAQHIDSATLHAVLQLQGPLAYHVSPLTAQQAGTSQPSYTYHAPIRHPEHPERVLGGIAIVFNTVPELGAMLGGALAGRAHTQALFVDRQGHVLASTDARWPSGSTLRLPCAELLQVPAHQASAHIAEFESQYCVLAASATRGYREFKTSDGYGDEVLAISVQALGAIAEAHHTVAHHRPRIQASHHHSIDTDHGTDMASFYVGTQLLAAPASQVLEALPAHAMQTVSASRLPHCRGTLARQVQGQVSGYVWVFDLSTLLGGAPTVLDEHAQVVVLEHTGRKLGLLVSALHGVHRFGPEHIVQAPRMAGQAGGLVGHLLRANAGQLLVTCLDLQGLLHSLQPDSFSAPALEDAQAPQA